MPPINLCFYWICKEHLALLPAQTNCHSNFCMAVKKKVGTGIESVLNRYCIICLEAVTSCMLPRAWTMIKGIFLSLDISCEMLERSGRKFTLYKSVEGKVSWIPIYCRGLLDQQYGICFCKDAFRDLSMAGFKMWDLEAFTL